MTQLQHQHQQEDYNIVILVHGAWHTGEVWNHVKQSIMMRQQQCTTATTTPRGLNKNKVIHEVLTPNLIGHFPGRYRCVDPMVPSSQFGELSQAFSKIGLEEMARQVVEMIREKIVEIEEQDEHLELHQQRNVKFHLVAHSASGVVIQHALSLISQDEDLANYYNCFCNEEDVETTNTTATTTTTTTILQQQQQQQQQQEQLIASVTFVSAYMVEDGKTLLEYVLRDAQQNGCTTTRHMIAPFERSPFCSFNTEYASSIFYNKVRSESMKQQAISNLVFQPRIIFAQPVRNGLTNYAGKVTYVFTRNDNAISRTLQTSMVQQQMNKMRTVEIDSDHSPMLSATQELVQILLDSF